MTQRKRLEKNLNRVKQMDAEQDCLFLETNICEHKKKTRKL